MNTVLQVVNVPGDHFSLLRQSEEGMQTLVNTLKLVLSPFGWQAVNKPNQKPYKTDEVCYNSSCQLSPGSPRAAPQCQCMHVVASPPAIAKCCESCSTTALLSRHA